MPKPPSPRATQADVDRFLTRSKTLARRAESGARLLFAMDATASRQPTWDRACQLQSQMFSAASDLGGLCVQLCYYRGINELRSTSWLVDDHALLKHMRRVHCEGGMTQIERLLNHGLREHREQRIKAIVFIGDACEESPDRLIGKAGELGVLQLPLFIFQEGSDVLAERCFRSMCKVSGGAWARFDHSSPEQLANLLGAVAKYAAGGEHALLQDGGNCTRDVTLLLEQLKRT
ncbi:MAG: VWA domain-containing protein [Pseudomonadota bacterium]